MSDVLFYPGRVTTQHERFLDEYGKLEGLRILVLDAGTADLAYASNSDDIVLCSNERYNLDIHRLLSLGPAHRYIRDKWENYFANGTDWNRRTRFVAALNNQYRRKRLTTWEDFSMYYCVLAMSGFAVTFKRWQLRGEYAPITPDYDILREWAVRNRSRDITYYDRNVYNFPTNEIDDNTVLYIHLPPNFAQYGCGYLWTKRKFKQVLFDINEFAKMGHKICVSFTHEKWGRQITPYMEYFQSDMFTTHIYSELKASRYGFEAVSSSEAYVVANM